MASIGVDFKIKNLEIDNKKVKLQIVRNIDLFYYN